MQCHKAFIGTCQEESEKEYRAIDRPFNPLVATRDSTVSLRVIGDVCVSLVCHWWGVIGVSLGKPTGFFQLGGQLMHDYLTCFDYFTIQC